MSFARHLSLVALGCAALAFLAGRCSVVPAAGPSRDSLALVAAAEDLRAMRATAAAALARADSLDALADSALAFADRSRRARHGVPLPPRPGPSVPPDAALPMLWERVDSLESQLARAEVELDSATASARRYREAHRGAVEAASLSFTGMMVAEGRLNQAAVRIGDLEGDLRAARGGTRWGLAATAVAAPHGWAAVAGPQVVARRTVLGIEAEASLTAGWSAGPAGSGPGAAVTLRVGI